jgi:2-polyprenyl-3-methyl-5-hydroxy-6-metoxy-1,4-benzoquinol methylase
MSKHASGADEGAYARKQLYSSSRLLTWSHKARFDLAVRLAQRFGVSRLLDYGCGDGTFLVAVSDKIAEGVGAEVDPQLIEDCRRRCSAFGNLSFVTVDQLVQHADGSFDTVFCMEVLEHCTPDAAERVLQDIHRLVDASGVVVISVPIETGPPLILKQAARAVFARTMRGDYAERETYSFGEMLRMIVPGEGSPVERPVYHPAGDVDRPGYHGHKGFNWRALRRRVARDFDIVEQTYSPVGVHPWLNSQAWLVCRKRVLS